MDAAAREELEQTILHRHAQGDWEGAATALIRGYGREILSFLAAVHGSEGDASEVFSLFSEGVWRGLPAFTPRGTFRTWAYAIARKASLRHRRDSRRRGARFEALPEGAALSGVVQEVRTETLWYLRTQVRDRFAEIRDRLPAEDRELLVLRVDRQLAFQDLAQMLRDEDELPLEGEALKREAARLRKRLQLLLEKLKEIGRREGLLPSGGGER